jgi:hypothetical protein
MKRQTFYLKRVYHLQPDTNADSDGAENLCFATKFDTIASYDKGDGIPP